jgi:hypothetical protein
VSLHDVADGFLLPVAETSVWEAGAETEEIEGALGVVSHTVLPILPLPLSLYFFSGGSLPMVQTKIRRRSRRKF